MLCACVLEYCVFFFLLLSNNQLNIFAQSNLDKYYCFPTQIRFTSVKSKAYKFIYISVRTDLHRSSV